jgi:alkanesulfonate monooxygenase SsuD/methylene tetrahydromethanopterin reductase-like flavin-dependent oxidoreductase (luciferase family)
VTVRVGTTLPQFRADPEPALAAATRAEALGLDGVFVFDHLWPLGKPDGAVLQAYPLLGALAEETRTIRVGPLVARVGLLPDLVLVNTLVSAAMVAGTGRLIAGLGTGDRLSKPENDAFGVGYDKVEARLASLARCCRALAERGIETWAGGRSRRLRHTAAMAADALNVWGATPEEVEREAADFRHQAGTRAVEVTWGGQVLIGRDRDAAAEKLERHGTRPGLVHGAVDDVIAHFRRLADLGATWVVASPIDIHDDPAALETLAGVREALQ